MFIKPLLLTWWISSTSSKVSTRMVSLEAKYACEFGIESKCIKKNIHAFLHTYINHINRLSVLNSSVRRAFASKLKGFVFQSRPGTVGGPGTMIICGAQLGWQLTLKYIMLSKVSMEPYGIRPGISKVLSNYININLNLKQNS